MAEEATERRGGGMLTSMLRVFVVWYGVHKVIGLMYSSKSTEVSSSSTQPVLSSSPPPPSPPHTTTFHPDPTDQTTSALNPAYGRLGTFPVFSPHDQKLPRHRNLFPDDVQMELRIYLSKERTTRINFTSDPLIWLAKNIPYHTDFDADKEQRQINLNITLTDHLLRNGTLYAHIFLTRQGFSPNPSDPAYDYRCTIYKRHQLVTYRPRPKVEKRRRLLGESDDQPEEPLETDDGAFLSFWKPSIRINPVVDFTHHDRATVPLPFLLDNVVIDPKTGDYFPILFLNEFWLLESHLIPINDTLSTLPLDISIYPLSIHKYALYHQMEQGFENQRKMGTQKQGDSDGFKRLIMDTNPILLAVTFLVSILHTLFDFLAFKNDVSFWKNQKSLEGLSLRSVAMNAFFQLVVFLYLVDNNTSWMILMSSGVGLLIDIWKIKKVVIISKDDTGKWRISGVASYSKSSTCRHDQVAISHLSFVLYPLLVGYSVYSLLYSDHKGWYSWIISSLTGFVYAFGFIMMTPQLYINYKLKSVAHLPWRAMVYKSLNTFIDDLFAFVIEMPIMHRLSCFRDDLIFFIFLYQKWAYPVDKNRINEFGQGGGDRESTATDSSKTPVLSHEVRNSSEADQSTEKDLLNDSSNSDIVKDKVLKRRGKFDKCK